MRLAAHRISRPAIAGLLAALLTLATACEGDLGPRGSQGEPGPDGPSGPPGPPGGSTEIPSALEITVTDVTVASQPVVEFQVTDRHGFAFPHLESGELSFTIARLEPGTTGDSDAWQSYINRMEQPGDSFPGTEPKLQATYESDGTLENLDDGRYRYTFATDIANVTDPVEITYDPDLTHRVGIYIRGSFRDEPLPAANATHTFQPSTGLTDGIHDRRIVDQASCNACHGQLAFHGGSRQDVNLCTTCHNPGTADAQSGHTVDFKVMIHKIHLGADLPSVQAGGDYVIYGYQNSSHDYSDLSFPQDTRNCTVCHDPENPETPEAVHYVERPTMQACGSCHDDVNFETGENHAGGALADNSQCASCHGVDQFASVESKHQMPARLAGEQFAFNILQVLNTAPGETPEVVLSVTDPTNSDAPYDILNDPEFGTGAALNIRFGWETLDYSNWPGGDTGTAPAQPMSVDALASGVDNGDGTFTVSAPNPVPATGVEGSGAVGMEGRAQVDGMTVPITAEVDYFAITDTDPVPRRQIVSVENCQVCHGERDGLAFHGNNRTDNVEMCVICHTPDTTDIRRRPVDPIDGLAERTVHFKFMIHAIHGVDRRDPSNPYVAYGYGNRAHDFSDVRYPRPPSDCTACHIDENLDLPLAAGVLGTTIDSGADRNDPTDDLNITPTASACTACHDSTLAREHMRHNGAAFDISQDFIDQNVVIETCSVCHGPGHSADVREVHGLD